MSLKQTTIREANAAQKQKTQQIMENERNPTANKIRGPRMEHEKLMEVILDLFSKHDYYHINDLTNITCQPQKAVRDVLMEIAVQSTELEFKHKWKLKSDYKYP